MEKAKRSLSLRAFLGAVAVVLVAAVFWAASAFAAGGPSSNEGGARDSPAAENAQGQGEAPDDDCPNRDGEAGSSTEV